MLWVVLLIGGAEAFAQAKEEKPAADPVNVLVDGLTFTRPSTWKWQPNSDASSAAARFVIPNKKSESITDVRFYVVEKPPAETLITWKGFYAEDSRYEERQEKTGKHDVTWLSITGIHKSKNKAAATSRFVGAIIPIHHRYITVRIFGPKAEVDEALRDFEEMIREALLADG